MHLKCLMHALSVIGLVLLFGACRVSEPNTVHVGHENPSGGPLPGFSLAQTSYLRLEILMDTDARRLAAQIPGQAAVRWENIASHPSLPSDRARIALTALLYGRTLLSMNL